MITTSIAIRLVAATVVLGSVALAGGAMAKPAANETAMAAAASTAVPASVAARASVAVDDTAAGCSRKVKVVYAGYGEADRMGCAAGAKSASK